MVYVAYREDDSSSLHICISKDYRVQELHKVRKKKFV